MEKKKREIVFRIILIGIIPAFFILTELGLRLFRYGGSTDLFVRVKSNRKDYYMVNPDLGKQYFLNREVRPYVSQDVIPVNKSEDAYRIFCLGASTTVGFPYMYNAAFPSLLRDRLDVLFPNRKIEVINLGVTAVNSFTVRDFSKQVYQYDPDLLIVYAGHNEFYGALGIGSVESGGKHPWTYRFALMMRKSRLVRLMRNVIRGLSSLILNKSEDSGQSLMEVMAKDRLIPYGSHSYKIAREYFKNNITDVVQTARRHNIPILLCTLVSNIGDQVPFMPVHHESLTQEQRFRWRQSFDRGVILQQEGDYIAAQAMLHKAVRQDSFRADGYFHLAQCYEQIHDTLKAWKAYMRARDLDALRFRAPTEFNTIIREIGETHGVGVVDLEQVFANASPGGITGWELFWEHVHPRLNGYGLMAKTICRVMATYGMITQGESWPWHFDRSDDAYEAISGVTEFDREAGRYHIEILKHRWPFRDSPERVEIEPKTVAQRFAWDYIQRRIGWAEAHRDLASVYLKEKNLARAEKELWALAKNNQESNHLLLMVADLQLNQKKLQESVETLLRALEIEENPSVHARLGAAFLSSNRFETAIFHFKEALDPDMNKDQPLKKEELFRTMFMLGEAFVKIGDRKGAERQLALLLRIAPDAIVSKTLERHIAEMK